jgi:hypothetical protein
VLAAAPSGAGSKVGCRAELANRPDLLGASPDGIANLQLFDNLTFHGRRRRRFTRSAHSRCAQEPWFKWHGHSCLRRFCGTRGAERFHLSGQYFCRSLELTVDGELPTVTSHLSGSPLAGVSPFLGSGVRGKTGRNTFQPDFAPNR